MVFMYTEFPRLPNMRKKSKVNIQQVIYYSPSKNRCKPGLWNSPKISAPREFLEPVMVNLTG